jgi:drug/metabolite transporter (DMT)-like permease
LGNTTDIYLLHADILYYLLLSIACSVAINLLFKLFDRWQIQTFQAIVANYVACVVTGSLALGAVPMGAHTLSEPWFPMALGLGVLFITGFFTMATTVQRFGVAIGTVTQKMSLLLSVGFAIWAFSEPVNGFKTAGLAAALCSVVLANWPDRSGGQALPYRTLWMLPAWTFLSSGLIECALNYTERQWLQSTGLEGHLAFTTVLFATALSLGLSALAFGGLRGQLQLHGRSLLAGLVLGIPNFGSIYFLLRALGEGQGSVVLPINNVAVIGVLALLAVLLFREKLSPVNWTGVGLSLLAIALTALGG